MTDETNTPASEPGLGRLPRRALDEAAGWIARRGAGALTAEERAEFEAWRAADPVNAEAYRRVAALWDSGELATAAQQHADPIATIAHRRRPGARAKRRGFGAMAGIAAVALVVLAIGLSQVQDIALALQADHRTAAGEQARVDLPDGSRMVLNSGAAVAVDYEEERRHIRLLDGEAYFEVARDPDRPFEVTGRDASAKALGTAFAVRAGERAVTVSVRHGEVAVTGGARPDRSAVLAAGERVRVESGLTGATTRFDPETALAWLQGRLIFRDRPLGEVVAELNRHHAGWIVIADETLRSHAVSGNYRLDDPAAAAAALAAAVSADIAQVTDVLMILY